VSLEKGGGKLEEIGWVNKEGLWICYSFGDEE
jgi:hypothetical protein